MSLRHVALSSCRPQPWRNGGGVTRELLAWPQAPDWLLRVSIADIDRGGPFSAYPDVDRWFAVIEGAGVRLDLPDGMRTLAVADEPVAFVGEAAPECQLIDGPTRDLNLMLRRDGLQACMHYAPAGTEFEGGTRWRGLFAADPAVLECDGVAEPVHAGTLVWTDATEAGHWLVRQAGRAWLMTVAAR
jgi:uncharacterized protein